MKKNNLIIRCYQQFVKLETNLLVHYGGSIFETINFMKKNNLIIRYYQQFVKVETNLLVHYGGSIFVQVCQTELNFACSATLNLYDFD